MGNGAMTVLSARYLALVREICDRYGLLLIHDEVMTGAGRTGTFLRTEALGVTPDLITMAKAISGGYAPLGAVLLHERVADAIARAGRRMDHVHTHSGHPVSCAVGLAVLDILEREELVAQAAERGTFFRAEMERQLGDHPFIGDVRGAGLAQAVEFVADRSTREAFPAESRVGASVWEGMLERGYLLPSGRHRDSGVDRRLLAVRARVHHLRGGDPGGRGGAQGHHRDDLARAGSLRAWIDGRCSGPRAGVAECHPRRGGPSGEAIGEGGRVTGHRRAWIGIIGTGFVGARWPSGSPRTARWDWTSRSWRRAGRGAGRSGWAPSPRT